MIPTGCPAAEPRAGAGPITILGAGIAGLVAAYELERLGYRVEVLEGSHRVGGRILTHRFGSDATGPLVEFGAMRVPSTHQHTLDYIAELGLSDRIRPFRSLFSEPRAYHATGRGYVRLDQAARILVEGFRADLPHGRYREETVLFGAWLTAMGNAIGPAGFRDRRFTVELLDAVDRIDLGPFVVGAGRDQIDLHGFFAGHPEVRAGCGGRLARFIDDVLSETSPELVRLEGGMDQLVRRLVSRVRSPIRLGCEVVGLDVRDRRVLVDLRIGDRVVTRSRSKVLCTLPFSVLRRLRLRNLSRTKVAAIRGMTYWSATKVAFHCREAFWGRDGISGGASFSGGRVRQTYYVPADGEPADGAVLLASYTLGEEADAFGRMPVVDRHEAVLRELSRMHPELLEPGMVLDAASMAWGQHWWSSGAAVSQWELDSATRSQERARAQSPENGLYFAGDHCSANPAWIDGAIQSAVDAVRRIHLDSRSRAAVPA
ncbi:flavin monoamine oxidase family protein [Saccharothrix algeriensis]|uniref:FAD-dependent oxidoreductase n=1 Tax=Saccharothrix algeriensis TaxID=173560 RepID=A0A8T8I0A1_9PSEU|nr:NAD(P)/FAD-dependent oxidoreductase [Saccharothrix algeriensis]MBM7809809.1 monoamine oxidase [Saccharothrix algeriensis]QTR04087.1 FAD-dependent oxidoreductase [Saccharothrix algeriensis]